MRFACVAALWVMVCGLTLAVEDAVVAPESPEAALSVVDEFLEIDGKFHDAYLREKPETFLVDPQGLLSAADSRERLEFLDYHASDSAVDFYVYIIGGDQRLPDGESGEGLVSRFFDAGRPVVLVCYYLGAPKRATVHFSAALSGAISVAEQRRALESCVMQAMERVQPFEQFEKFLIQMSIRIYWMERLVAGEVLESEGEAADAGVGEVATKEGAKGDERFGKIRAWVEPYWFPIGWFGGGILGLGLMIRWRRVRARYRFPEFEIEPRLGGAHAAGVGAVISFANAAVPPASQRDQVPEYMRRA